MMNLSKRVEKLLSLTEKYDGFLITDPKDIFYYTGYKPLDKGLLLILKKRRPVLFISPLEEEAEKNKVADVVFMRKINDIIKRAKGKKIGFDENELNYSIYSKLRGKMKLRKASDIIKRPMQIKDIGEIKKIKTAVDITKHVLSYIDIIKKEERDVSVEIKKEFLRNNASEAFSTIVASGKNSHYVHHRPGKNIIKETDLTIVDLGAQYNEYCADMTRTFCFLPNKKRKNIMSDVQEIQREIIDSIVVGMKFDEIQELYEKLMKKRGYKILHLIGHGIGLHVHENVDIVENNMTMSIEPGVYIKNIGGCRKEDVILIKNNKAKII